MQIGPNSQPHGGGQVDPALSGSPDWIVEAVDIADTLVNTGVGNAGWMYILTAIPILTGFYRLVRPVVESFARNWEKDREFERENKRANIAAQMPREKEEAP